jgi:hypothetical protein
MVMEWPDEEGIATSSPLPHSQTSYIHEELRPDEEGTVWLTMNDGH